VWEEQDGYDDQIPVGQKMWLADDEEIPFLELRSLEFTQASVAA
jgi:protein involved in temperature-dependent protein secretion